MMITLIQRDDKNDIYNWKVFQQTILQFDYQCKQLKEKGYEVVFINIKWN